MQETIPFSSLDTLYQNNQHEIPKIKAKIKVNPKPLNPPKTPNRVSILATLTQTIKNKLTLLNLRPLNPHLKQAAPNIQQIP